MTRFLKYTIPLYILFILLPTSSCKKETACNGVPVVSVYFQIDPNLGYPQLNPVGNNEVFSGGYANNGVIVYHYTQNQFYAYDCTCPYDGNTNAKAVVSAPNVSSLYAVCPVCGSSFLLSTGSPNKGPSTCPLKAYTASYDGQNITVQN